MDLLDVEARDACALSCKNAGIIGLSRLTDSVPFDQVGQFRDLKAPSSMHLGEQLKELRKENAQLVERAMRADALQKELAEAEKQVMLLGLACLSVSYGTALSATPELSVCC